MKSKKITRNLKKKCDQSCIKSEVLAEIDSAIDIASGSLEDALKSHKWRIRRVNDDRILDCASKCFKTKNNLEEIRARVGRIRKSEKVANEFVDFEREFGWFERDLEELVGKIG